MKEWIVEVVKYIKSSPEQKKAINDYLHGYRFMTRYHGGAKKEYPVKAKKVRKAK
jgi:hypothetical protein